MNVQPNLIKSSTERKAISIKLTLNSRKTRILSKFKLWLRCTKVLELANTILEVILKVRSRRKNFQMVKNDIFMKIVSFFPQQFQDLGAIILMMKCLISNHKGPIIISGLINIKKKLKETEKEA